MKSDYIMDTSQPTTAPEAGQPNDTNLSEFKKPFPLPILVGIGLFLVAIVLLVIVYKLSFNSKRHIASQIPEKILITCPTIQSFCKNSSVFIESSMSGKLRSGDPIIAIFDGVVEQITSSQPIGPKMREDYQVAFLTNSSNTLRGIYIYKGSQALKNNYKAGEIIATSSGELISFIYNQPSFFLKLASITSQGDNSIHLSKENVKN